MESPWFGLSLVVVTLLLLSSVPLRPLAGTSPPSSGAPSPTAFDHRPSARGFAPPPRAGPVTCPIGYPLYVPLGGVWPLDPNFYQQMPCPPIAQDEIHASYSSAVPGSGERWTQSITLPAEGAGGQENVSNGIYLGMVVSGDYFSPFNQSYLEVIATPVSIVPGVALNWNVTVALWSIVNSSIFLPPSCSGGMLNFTWNNSYWCETDDMAGGVPDVLQSSLPAPTTLNVTFAGVVKGPGAMRIWVNDTADASRDANVTLQAPATAFFPYQPTYSSACVDLCYLSWGLSYGLGVGVDLCPVYFGTANSCNAYNQTHWNSILPTLFGIPRFDQAGSYSGEYRYLSPESASGVCNNAPPVGVIVANCNDFTNYGGNGYYPFFSLASAGLEFGTPGSSVRWTFGGATQEYLITSGAQDLTPFLVYSVSNDSRAGYIPPLAEFNVTTELVDLGSVASATLHWRVGSGSFTSTAMTLTSGTSSDGNYTGLVPTGPNGRIQYYVTSVNTAGAGTGSGNYSVLRGPLPHFQVTVESSNPSCGSVTLNGTVEPNGSVVSFLPGDYSLVAKGCYPYIFGGWSTTPGLLVLPGTSPVGVLRVSASGIVEILWTYVKPLDTLSVGVVPSGCGYVTVNGTLFSNGQVVRVLDRLPNTLGYFVSCAGYGFGGWTPSTNVSILGTSMTLAGNGTLTVTFLPTAGDAQVTFYTNPSNCGGIDFAGAGYTDGESLWLVSSGGGSIGPLPCAHYGFLNFTTTGGVSVGAGHLTASSSGSVLENNYHLTEVFVSTNPTNCGGVDFDGTFYTNGADLVVQNHSVHSVLGVSCVGHYLESLTATGGLLLSGTTLTVDGSGTLLVVSLPGVPLYFLGFLTNPSTCGVIDFNGTQYVNGNYLYVAPQTTGAVQAGACPNYGFSGWTTTGGVAVRGPNVYVNASGSLEANFQPIAALAIATQPETCGTVAIGGTPYSNGAAAYLTETVAYSVAVTPCAGYVLANFATSPGVAISNGVLVLSAPASLTAVFQPAEYTITVFVTGLGCGTVTLNHVPASNGSVFQLPAGTYPISALPCAANFLQGWVGTGLVSVGTGTITVSGNGALSADFEPTPPSLSLGVPGAGYVHTAVFLTASVAVPLSGSGYSYRWDFGDGSATTTSSDFTTHTWSIAGNFVVHVTVTDPFHRTANASSTIHVLSSGSAFSWNSFEPGLIAAGAAAAALLGVFGFSRRRRSSEPRER